MVYEKTVKKFKIRLYGHGGIGECEVVFNQEPTVKMVEDKVTSCLKDGSLRLQKEKFYTLILSYKTLLHMTGFLESWKQWRLVTLVIWMCGI